MMKRLRVMDRINGLMEENTRGNGRIIRLTVLEYLLGHQKNLKNKFTLETLKIN